MKIIILEDLKGFRKILEVAFFTPDYRVVETKPISCTSDFPLMYSGYKEIVFYPKGDSKTDFGVETRLYKQLKD